MCGICGIVELGRPPQTETVAGMRTLLAHRGPDGVGSYDGPGVALGHARLAIIDLTDGGLQPFSSEDGRFQLLHNGEIYNYRELRTELTAAGHRFRSATDTEVLLTAYREWGTRCVERFAGMWAFAIWDEAVQSLFCSRDRFGIKPFYYRLKGSRFAFASELKAFKADAQTRLHGNERVIADYLAYGYLDHTAETFFSGINALPPAHSLEFDSSGLRVTRYWQLAPADATQEDRTAAVRELFLDSVRLHLRSDVPIGTALSGGIDSSAIACGVGRLLETEREAATAVGPRQRTFTAFFEDAGFDERPYARIVLERTAAEPHWVTFDAADLVGDLPTIVASQDEPFGSASIVAQWYVMRAAARAGVKVMLDGQGGDELFAGYPAYWGARFADLLLSGRVGELARESIAHLRAPGTHPLSLLAATMRPALPEQVNVRVRSLVTGASALVGPRLRSFTRPPKFDERGDDRLHRLLYRMLTQQGLPELLRYEDRNSMAHSIEARVPFLDHRLAEMALSLDPRDLLATGETKVVLRRALSDLLPPEIAARRDKLGFVTPGGRFFRESLGELAADVFASQAFIDRGFVDAAAARRRLARHRRKEVEAGFELWRALNLELWARTYLD